MDCKSASPILLKGDSLKLSDISVVNSFNSRLQSLSHNNTRNKIIMDMVIHDMRNPTNSIQYALKKCRDSLSSVSILLEDHAHFTEKCQSLFIQMSDFQLTEGITKNKLLIVIEQMDDYVDYI